MKRLSIIIIIVMLSLSLYACVENNREEEIEIHLSFNEDGEFVILHLADLHECLNGRDELDELNYNFMVKVLEDIKPHLVVLGGDNVFPLSNIGELTRKETLITIDALADVFNEFKTPWTMVFGNHDDESIYDKTAQLNRAMLSPYFVGGFTDNDLFYAYVDTSEDMVGNYMIPVYDGDRIGYNVLCLDSGSARKNKNYDYNFIKDSQVDWYKDTAELIKERNDGVLAPTVAFFHIPLLDYIRFYDNRDNTDMVIEYKGQYGGYAVSDYQCSFYDAAVEVGDVKGMFAGHNHRNSMTMLAKTDNQNIMISNTRQAGVYINYEDLHSRVIVLNKDGGFYTYEYQTEPFNIMEYR